MPRPIRAWSLAGDIVAPSQAATRWSPVGIRTWVVGLIQLRGHVLKGGHGTRASRIRQRIVCDLSVELGRTIATSGGCTYHRARLDRPTTGVD